jgi:hypothetical protein
MTPFEYLGRELESSLPVATENADEHKFAPGELIITNKGEMVWRN